MRKKLNLKWVSEVIGEDYNNWYPGEIVTIQAQTGTGKTYFITGGKDKEGLIDRLNPFERIIYICNRVELKRQLKKDLLIKFKKDIPKLENGELDISKLDKITQIENVVITSYHAIAEGELDNQYLNTKKGLDDFKYIICDECHFFLTDADFYNKSYLAFNQLIENKHNNSIKIFISATMDEMLPIIQKRYHSKVHEYTTGIDYSYLNVKYFNKISLISKLIKNDQSEDKWMIFVTSKKHGTTLQRELDNCGISSTFIYSGSKTKDGKMITNTGKFESKVLISTKCLDNGVNIVDEKVKNMVVMAFDKTTFIQEIGRRRFNINNAPTINLYINTMYKKTFNGKLNRLIDKKNMVELYNNDISEFKRKYNNRLYSIHNDLFYLDNDNKWVLNRVGYARLIKDISFINKIINRFYNEDKYAYIRQQMEWLGLECLRISDNLITDITDNEEETKLIKYLESIIGKRLYKEDQEQLSKLIISELTTISKNIDYRTKVLKPKTLENIIREQLELDFAVSKSKKEDRIINGERVTRRYIEIYKI